MFVLVNPEDANLLGFPIGGSQSVDACLKEKIELLRLMGDRSEHLQSHVAITCCVTLLRSLTLYTFFVQLPVSLLVIFHLMIYSSNPFLAILPT